MVNRRNLLLWLSLWTVPNLYGCTTTPQSQLKNRWEFGITTKDVDIIFAKSRHASNAVESFGQPADGQTLPNSALKEYLYTFQNSRPYIDGQTGLVNRRKQVTMKKFLRIWVNPDDYIERYELTGVFYVHIQTTILPDSIVALRSLTTNELNNTEIPHAPGELAR